MQFRTSDRRVDSEFALLPLTNIVFLLMIFFLLIGHIAEPRAFPVHPPKSSSKSRAGNSAIRIDLGAHGQIAIDGKQVDAKQLASAIKGRRLNNRKRAVRLEADGNGDATRVVRIMQIIHSAGVKKLRLVTRSS